MTSPSESQSSAGQVSLAVLVGVCGSLGLISVVLILIVTLIVVVVKHKRGKRGYVPIVVHLMNDFSLYKQYWK